MRLCLLILLILVSGETTRALFRLSFMDAQFDIESEDSFKGCVA